MILALRRTQDNFQSDFGAGNGIRTRDIQLGRLALYQLSYSRWWHIGGEGRIRTSVARKRQIYSLFPLSTRVPPHSKQLLIFEQTSTRIFLVLNSLQKILGTSRFWSWRRDLNPRPADYKSAALPTELRQHFFPLRLLYIQKEAMIYSP